MASEKTYSLQEDIKWVRSLYRDYGEIPLDAIASTLGLLPRFLDALEAVPAVAASPTGAQDEEAAAIRRVATAAVRMHGQKSIGLEAAIRALPDYIRAEMLGDDGKPQSAPPSAPALEWRNGRASVEGDGWRAVFSLQDPERTGLELSCDWYLPCDISDFWNNHPLASEAEAFALADVWARQLAGVAAVLKAHEPVFLAWHAGALAGTEVRDGE